MFTVRTALSRSNTVHVITGSARALCRRNGTAMVAERYFDAEAADGALEDVRLCKRCARALENEIRSYRSQGAISACLMVWDADAKRDVIPTVPVAEPVQSEAPQTEPERIARAEADGRSFYVSVRDTSNPKRFGLLAGPFDTEREARMYVEPARHEANQRAQDAPWHAYGTASMPADYRTPGSLNAALGLLV